MKKWHVVSLMFSLSLVLLIAACGGGSEPASDEGGERNEAGNEEVFVLRAGHSLPEDHPYELGFQRMAENVEQRTDGRVKIETYPNSQIGAERELVEGLTLGTVDLVVTSTAPVTNFVPELGVLDLPFLFNDRETAVRVLEGEIGEELFAKIREHGIIPLSWGENGFRHITNSIRPVHTPDDLKGLKIRTQENEIHLAAFRELGAQPTPMAWTEALTALQQGVVDAQENPAIVADQFNLYDAGQKYMSLTGHVYSVAVYLLSEETYNKLPEDLRQIVVEEGQKVGAYQRDLIVEMEQESLEKLKEQGMEIIEDVDITPFRDAMAPVYSTYQYQDLLERVLNAQQ
ncbi:TRAP dicarboxylate transporter, DctP subunit [Caldalkalibacillus thermarum TA2.A1]|uniref:TRAP dicarboxylate transporter, DctP subunit n=1 Tax=Caldalkalibacillus thermarum (strain TA2.A1) TaxID=986075 RepID=F5LA28_CALTT|nr:TRAP transporter substrate-binding protein [Caldalkalibacillus thermarum]EGL81748.1 TRAP dicarboxylate transporter, DctP subunit [Caldalkalibacillus thermarum TA2.A1]QZT34127.1 TRAP transporter substrate-binding protein [Caldalkalibacillus thermarum TA2.A1]